MNRYEIKYKISEKTVKQIFKNLAIYVIEDKTVLVYAITFCKTIDSQYLIPDKTV